MSWIDSIAQDPHRRGAGARAPPKDILVPSLLFLVRLSIIKLENNLIYAYHRRLTVPSNATKKKEASKIRNPRSSVFESFVLFCLQNRRSAPCMYL